MNRRSQPRVAASGRRRAPAANDPRIRWRPLRPPVYDARTFRVRGAGGRRRDVFETGTFEGRDMTKGRESRRYAALLVISVLGIALSRWMSAAAV